ncbi:8924_t:CDS:2, partial [Dentiscutata erythropus]
NYHYSFHVNFTYLQKNPQSLFSVGDKAQVTLLAFNGTVTFVQGGQQNDTYTYTIAGVIKKDINENTPNNYFMAIDKFNVSFSELNITINPPEAVLFDFGFILPIIGEDFTILK